MKEVDSHVRGRIQRAEAEMQRPRTSGSASGSLSARLLPEGRDRDGRPRTTEKGRGRTASGSVLTPGMESYHDRHMLGDTQLSRLDWMETERMAYIDDEGGGLQERGGGGEENDDKKVVELTLFHQAESGTTPFSARPPSLPRPSFGGPTPLSARSEPPRTALPRRRREGAEREEGGRETVVYLGIEDAVAKEKERKERRDEAWSAHYQAKARAQGQQREGREEKGGGGEGGRQGKAVSLADLVPALPNVAEERGVTLGGGFGGKKRVEAAGLARGSAASAAANDVSHIGLGRRTEWKSGSASASRPSTREGTPPYLPSSRQSMYNSERDIELERAAQQRMSAMRQTGAFASMSKLQQRRVYRLDSDLADGSAGGGGGGGGKEDKRKEGGRKKVRRDGGGSEREWGREKEKERSERSAGLNIDDLPPEPSSPRRGSSEMEGRLSREGKWIKPSVEAPTSPRTSRPISREGGWKGEEVFVPVTKVKVDSPLPLMGVDLPSLSYYKNEEEKGAEKRKKKAPRVDNGGGAGGSRSREGGGSAVRLSASTTLRGGAKRATKQGGVEGGSKGLFLPPSGYIEAPLIVSDGGIQGWEH
eukprot:CAMPEP_0113903274 /NCGR_PEP_ID=MMETSP0780_2-20120614/22416_1 /TAXON_ID=652834 /ORGANISM="Palpitomonas bilix" /LENGTH=591 /DNA_ID=CAMNT_0000896375 /DNA_START=210 /DNA_END=1986 /DNA_ORIENTATION=+ /assembly_acc=CAM_ASM_000599